MSSVGERLVGRTTPLLLLMLTVTSEGIRTPGGHPPHVIDQQIFDYQFTFICKNEIFFLET